MDRPDFEKYGDGLIPVIVQDEHSLRVLMLGFMNEEAYLKTTAQGRVSFYSRSKQRLWTKGETSGNFLEVKEMMLDCDNDSLLVKAKPAGPVCHTGKDTCFNETNRSFTLNKLEETIRSRKEQGSESSYTSSLFKKGINAISQKLGEEAVELVIESKDNDKEKFLNEAADLLFHYLVLLAAKDCRLDEVMEVLESRKR